MHRPGFVGELDKTTHGTQDASNAWQKLWGEHLRSNGFELGASNPALYRSVLLNGFCHGDDSVVAAAEDQVENFGNLLQRKFETRRIGIIGAAEYLNKELYVLHRSVRVINSELMEIEADQKHVPQLLEDLARFLKGGLRQEKYCVIPRRFPPKRSWKCTWTAIGLETQYRVEAHLARFCDEENTFSDTALLRKTSLDSVVLKVSTTRSQRADVQDWDCKARLLTGI